MPRLSANSCGRDLVFVPKCTVLFGTVSRSKMLSLCTRLRGSALNQDSSAYLCNGVLDDLLVRHIALVTDEKLVNAFGGISIDLLEPLLHVVERVHIGDIVDDADTVSTTVVR